MVRARPMIACVLNGGPQQRRTSRWRRQHASRRQARPQRLIGLGPTAVSEGAGHAKQGKQGRHLQRRNIAAGRVELICQSAGHFARKHAYFSRHSRCAGRAVECAGLRGRLSRRRYDGGAWFDRMCVSDFDGTLLLVIPQPRERCADAKGAAVGRRSPMRLVVSHLAAPRET